MTTGCAISFFHNNVIVNNWYDANSSTVGLITFLLYKLLVVETTGLVVLSLLNVKLILLELTCLVSRCQARAISWQNTFEPPT